MKAVLHGYMSNWTCAPTHCIAGIMELYKQFTKVYSLAQSKYLERHNSALKLLFFEMLRDLKLANKVPLWFSQVRPRPLYKSPDAEAFWDVPVYADHTLNLYVLIGWMCALLITRARKYKWLR